MTNQRSNDEQKQQMKEYTNFIQNVLEPKLKQLQMEQKKYKQEVQEYQELQTKLDDLSSSVRQKQQQEKFQNEGKLTATDTSETMMVDLGHGAIYCRAKFFNNDGNGDEVNTSSNTENDDKKHNNDTNKSTFSIFIHVGLGFHVECTTIVHAKDVCTERIKFLQTQRIRPIHQQIQQVREHLSSARTLMDQLQSQMR